jgi:LEA14-like dessication related protein
MNYIVLTLAALFFAIPGFALNLKVPKGVSTAVQELPKPTVTLKHVDITSISFTDIHFLFTISIGNPYPIGLNLDRLRCDFNLEQNKIFSTETAGRLVVPAKASSDAQLDVGLTFKSIIDAAKAYNQNEKVDLQLAGEIVIVIPEHNKVPGAPATLSIPFSLTKAVPTLKPTVTVKNITVEMPDDKTIAAAIAKSGKKALNPAGVKKSYNNLLNGKKEPGAAALDPLELDLVFKTSFDIELKNETTAKLAFKALNYNFSMNGAVVATGETSEISGQGNTSLIHVVNTLSSKSLGESLVKAFKDRRAEYVLGGVAFLNLPPDIKPEPLKLDFNVTGATGF